MGSLLDFLARNKTKIGLGLGAAAGTIITQHIGPNWFQELAQLMAAFLVGGGVMESDATHKDMQRQIQDGGGK